MCRKAVHYSGNTTNIFKHGTDNTELQQRVSEECVQPTETDSTQRYPLSQSERVSSRVPLYIAMNALQRRLRNVCRYSHILKTDVFALML